jgi:hypothetical protein
METTLILILTCLGLSYVCGHLSSAPLRRLGDSVPFVTQFFIVDFFVLLGQFMVSGLLVLGPAEGGGDPRKLLMLYALWLLMAGWWWLGIRTLSRARLTSYRVRIFFLAVIVPISYGLPVFFFLAIFAVRIMSGPDIATLSILYWSFSLPAGCAGLIGNGVLLMLPVLGLLAFLLPGIMARKMAREHENGEDEGETDLAGRLL